MTDAMLERLQAVHPELCPQPASIVVEAAPEPIIEPGPVREPRVRDFLLVSSNSTTDKIRISDIQRVVAAYYNVTRADIISSRRTANVVQPRQVAMYLAKTLTLRSYPEIGRCFRRDHTTVLHAFRKIGGLVSTSEAIAVDIAELQRRIGNPMREAA